MRRLEGAKWLRLLREKGGSSREPEAWTRRCRDSLRFDVRAIDSQARKAVDSARLFFTALHVRVCIFRDAGTRRRRYSASRVIVRGCVRWMRACARAMWIALLYG